MFYGLTMSLAVAAPIAYLLWCDIKNHNKIKYLEEQVSKLSNKSKQHDDDLVFLKNNQHAAFSQAALSYKILKEQCKRMGTCGLFK